MLVSKGKTPPLATRCAFGASQAAALLQPVSLHSPSHWFSCLFTLSGLRSGLKPISVILKDYQDHAFKGDDQVEGECFSKGLKFPLFPLFCKVAQSLG